ncbi:WD repeat domain phosphoinositide-interacting protein 1 isoform X1 [Falco rusticolus]|uniref:WD repeat domain phosphoinositide-interacting protein 1 isoform X1 n=2 Tax=Falco rusticolus TaxID=120794 RepID=UPI001886A7B0|nr:WD repeat domain phosphoinositide-interacting protein 1 isoform X1 [Falco rusticolus]XP_055583734.1 WD repeat domain phosphoinositide-interacting protein 1 isoform X1 [Falco cherrug]
MEAAAEAPGGPAALSCFSYNQDCTSLAIGTTTGYRLFSLSSVDQLDQVHESNEIPDVYIVERLFSSSLVVVVSHARPQQMNVYHFKKGTEICNYSYSSNILSIRLNRQRLVVCLEESIYIHNIKDMKLLKTIMDTPPNTTGLCTLSINHANSYLAYPGSATSGEIALYDGNTLKTACTIPAHDGPLAALAFNSTGSKLASASEKGTVIRVFSIPGGQKLYEFRRGMKRYVNISSLVFSMDSQFLCASSNTETVHIFKLEHLTDSRPEEPPTWSGYMGKMFQAATNYLPAQVSGMMNQDRAFATVRLNISGQRNICALSTIQKLPRLLVTTSDGHLFIYNLDPQDGGECVLIKKHSLLGSGKTEENKENNLRPPLPQSYAATVARQSTVPSTSTMPGYSEDGGALRGEVIPEHEFATGPVCLDDENEFPPEEGQIRGEMRSPRRAHKKWPQQERMWMLLLIVPGLLKDPAARDNLVPWRSAGQSEEVMMRSKHPRLGQLLGSALEKPGISKNRFVSPPR